MEFIDTAEIWNGMGGLKPNGRFKYMYKTMEPITYPLNLGNFRSSESKEHSCHSWNRHWVQNCMWLSVGLMATGRDEIDLERLLRLIRSFNTCPRQLWHVHILDWRKPLHTKLSISFRYLILHISWSELLLQLLEWRRCWTQRGWTLVASHLH
jgi:hypothetical protein